MVLCVWLKKYFEGKAVLYIDTRSGEVCPEKTEAGHRWIKSKKEEARSQSSVRARAGGGGGGAWRQSLGWGAVRTEATCCNRDGLVT